MTTFTVNPDTKEVYYNKIVNGKIINGTIKFEDLSTTEKSKVTAFINLMNTKVDSITNS